MPEVDSIVPLFGLVAAVLLSACVGGSVSIASPLGDDAEFAEASTDSHTLVPPPPNQPARPRPFADAVSDTLPNAATTMYRLLTNTTEAVFLTHNTTAADGQQLHGLVIASMPATVPMPGTSANRGGQASRGSNTAAPPPRVPSSEPFRYVGAAGGSTGVLLCTSRDLREWVVQAELLVSGGAAALDITAVSGRGPQGSNGPWWVLAYQTGNHIDVVLFNSTMQLLSGATSRRFSCPMAQLLPAGERSPVFPASYSSPSILAAVYSRRGGRLTVDIVLSVTWADAEGITHPANALVDGLSPDAWTTPAFRVIYGYDGRSYGDNAYAGPLTWESKLKATVPDFAYTGSGTAFVPCGPGCGDPRERSGGGVDGVPGTVKISMVSGVANGKGQLLLWAWDPITKAPWLWPSGYGTGQGGFEKKAIVLELSGVVVAAAANPKLTVVACPPDITQNMTYRVGATPLCLWIGVSVCTHDHPLSSSRMVFVQVLETQWPSMPTAPFAARYTTQVGSVPSTDATLRYPVKMQVDNVMATKSGQVLKNDAFEVTIAKDGSNFTIATVRGADGSTVETSTQTFQSAFTVVTSMKDPKLGDVKDGLGLYSIADDVPSFWMAKRTTSVFHAGDTAVNVTAVECANINGSAVSLTFTPTSKFDLVAMIELPGGTGLPRLQWTLTPKVKAFFSAAFVGAASVAPNMTLGFSQPANCFKQEQNPPPTSLCPLDHSPVVPDAGANLPYAMISVLDSAANPQSTTEVATNIALLVDPDSTIPFDPCVPWPDHPPQFSASCPSTVCSGGPPDSCQNRGWASQARTSLGVRVGPMAQPVVWAPVLGGFGSAMTEGAKFQAAIQLLVHHGTPSSAYRKLASEVYGFRDERDNSGTGSLNSALERMGDYLADADGNNFQQWDAIQKYSFYWVDQPCAFKPLDILSGLSVALSTDDDRMFVLFARQTAKFALSRSDPDHYLWPYKETVGLYKPGTQVHLGMGENNGSGFAQAPQVLQIHRLTGAHSPALLEVARSVGYDPSLACPNADHPYDVLEFYRASTDQTERQWWWNCTLQIATSLTMTPNGPNRGQPAPSSTQKCENIDFFLDLLSEIPAGSDQIPVYRRAAQQCEANCEASYQVFPRATAVDGTVVTVDSGNASMSYWWTHGRFGGWGWPGGELPMWTPEKTVPTWRASHNGIRVSGGGGGGGWLGTLSLNSPVGMLRASTLGNDTYARALARASLVGRFAHFPGDFQGKPGHTLLWESPDLADHILPKEKQTTWNTGHFWAIAGVVVDFLLSDAADRSNGTVRFASTFVDAMPFGRMYSPALGPGSIYGEEVTGPWIPAGLFTYVDNMQFNWVAAYADDAVYIILLSQSFVAEEVQCELNSVFVGGLNVSGGITATLWVNNAPQPAVVVIHGVFKISVPSKGIAVVKLPKTIAHTRLHRSVLAHGLPPLSRAKSRVVNNTAGPFGIVTAMALRWGANMTELYAFSQANSTLWKTTVAADQHATSHVVFDTVTMNWAIDNKSQMPVVLTTFPFDFTMQLPDDCGEVEFSLSGVTSDGDIVTTEPLSVVVTGIK